MKPPTVLTTLSASVYDYARNPSADSGVGSGKAVLMLFPILIFVAVGLVCIIRPASVERSSLRWRGYNDTEPSERAIRRVRIGGIILLLCAAGYFGLFLYMITA